MAPKTGGGGGEPLEGEVSGESPEVPDELAAKQRSVFDAGAFTEGTEGVQVIGRKALEEALSQPVLCGPLAQTQHRRWNEGIDDIAEEVIQKLERSFPDVHRGAPSELPGHGSGAAVEVSKAKITQGCGDPSETVGAVAIDCAGLTTGSVPVIDRRGKLFGAEWIEEILEAGWMVFGAFGAHSAREYTLWEGAARVEMGGAGTIRKVFFQMWRGRAMP